MSNPKLIRPTSANDREGWWEFGIQKEQEFVDRVAPGLGLRAEINPERLTNLKSFDLLVNGQPADLKYSDTTFEIAENLFGVRGDHLVALNKTDFGSYFHRYPNLTLYYWIQRPRVYRYKDNANDLLHIPSLFGVWCISIKKVSELVQAGMHYEYSYKNRIGKDEKNKKISFFFDLYNPAFVCLGAYCQLPPNAKRKKQHVA